MYRIKEHGAEQLDKEHNHFIHALQLRVVLLLIDGSACPSRGIHRKDSTGSKYQNAQQRNGWFGNFSLKTWDAAWLLVRILQLAVVQVAVAVADDDHRLTGRCSKRVS